MKKQSNWILAIFAIAMSIGIAVLLRVERVNAAANLGSTGQSNIVNAPINANGGVYATGGGSFNAIGTPAVGSVANVGTAGTTTYTYYCVAQDINGASGVVLGTIAPGAVGGETIPSSSFTTTTGNATLSATNYNVISCGGKAGAVAWRVLKADTSHSLGICYTNPGQGCSVTDNTTGAGTAYTANTVDQTGMLYGARANCGGQTIVSAGSVVVTAPCISAYSSCSALPAAVGVSTPVAGSVANCSPTSTATVIGAATVTVGAVKIFIAGTPSPSPYVNWWAGPQ